MTNRDIMCPYCKNVLSQYNVYERDAPSDKHKDKELMVKVEPCMHSFPKDLFVDYLDSSRIWKEYVDEYVTAVGDEAREGVVDEYEEDVEELRDLIDQCCAEVEFTRPPEKV